MWSHWWYLLLSSVSNKLVNKVILLILMIYNLLEVLSCDLKASFIIFLDSGHSLLKTGYRFLQSSYLSIIMSIIFLLRMIRWGWDRIWLWLRLDVRIVWIARRRDYVCSRSTLRIEVFIIWVTRCWHYMCGRSSCRCWCVCCLPTNHLGIQH